MLFVRKIDENGIFVEDAIIEEIPLATETIIVDGEEITQPKLDENGNTYLDPHYITTPCPQGFIRPKWNGAEWVEGGTPVELTEEQKEMLYKARVVELIREQYSADDEMAILRKHIADIDDGEFEVYNTFAETCKEQAKAELFSEWEDDILTEETEDGEDG